MASDVRVSMSARVTTMRRQDRHQDEQTEELFEKNHKNSSSGHGSIRDEDRQQRCHQPTRELKTMENVGIHET